jgi:glycosyltransferase involved in cell wall biosynthesis
MIKISIITVSYNGVKTIRDTIESVISQDYPNIEYIIIDGLSNDGTQAIIESFGDCIAKFISEKDNGIYEAINKGIEQATGDIIGFIGSDDIYPHTEVISRVAMAFDKKNTDSLYGDKQYIDHQNKIVRYWKAGEYKHSNFLLGWMPPHLAFYLKRSCYLQYGFYNENFAIAGDYELMLRMLYKNRITTQYLPEVLMSMRIGGASTKNIKNRLKANFEDRQAWKSNAITPKFYTLCLKPLLKIPQFLIKRR